MPQVSVFIICQDEAPWIEACIRSCARFEEIVVVDSGSTDGTLDIIERLTAEGFPVRLHRRPWPGYARQKQFAMEQCTGAWALCLDADERLDPALVDAVFEETAGDGDDYPRCKAALVMRSYRPAGRSRQNSFFERR